VAPVTSTALVAADSGVVFDVAAREGIETRQGTTLMRIRNLSLERDAWAAARARDSLALRESAARARGQEGQAARLAAEGMAESARAAGLRSRIESLILRAPGSAMVATLRPEEQTGRRVDLGDTLLVLADPDRVEARIALLGAGASLVHPGLPVRLVSHADPAQRLETTVSAVSLAAADSAGAVETRVRIPAEGGLRPGMTGEASVTLRRSNLWGGLWWALRRRVRTDILL
jgi:hypothetical protein